MNTYIQDKLDEFDEKVNNTYEFFNATDGGGELQYTVNEIDVDGVRNFIQQSLTDYHNHIVEKIEGMKLEIPEYRNKRGHHTTSAHMKIRHNKALQMVQSLLQDTNPKE